MLAVLLVESISPAVANGMSTEVPTIGNVERELLQQPEVVAPLATAGTTNVNDPRRLRRPTLNANASPFPEGVGGPRGGNQRLEQTPDSAGGVESERWSTHSQQRNALKSVRKTDDVERRSSQRRMSETRHKNQEAT